MDEPSVFPTWPEMRPTPPDGIAGLYANRALDRGDDPRALVTLSRFAREEEDRLPVMASPFEDGFVLYDLPAPRRGRGGPRRLLVAAAVAAALIPLGAMVAGAQPLAAVAGPETLPGAAAGYEAEIDLPEIDGGYTAGLNPATLGLPPVMGSGAGGGNVTVDGRQRRNQVDAQVFTSEESTIMIDGEMVGSSVRPPAAMPGGFPRIP